MLLDEINKTGSDIRGDPASATDLEHNKAFNNHYFECSVQPIKGYFCGNYKSDAPNSSATLRQTGSHQVTWIYSRRKALPGYTSEEKLSIAIRHSIRQVLSQHGLSSGFVQIPEAMVILVIQKYTREAGLRYLERNLVALVRAMTVKVAEQEHVVPFIKDVQPLSAPLLGDKLAESTEVEMEVIPMGVNNHDIYSTL